MGKTDFINGTVVTPDFLDTLYLTNGGHKHDGIDDDGHAGKISLETDVSGVLHDNNIGDHFHDGSRISKIVLSEGADVIGQLPLVNMQAHVHDGQQRSKIHPYEHIEYVSTTTFAITLRQFDGGDLSIIVKAVIVDRENIDQPRLVKLIFPETIGISNGSLLTSVGTANPIIPTEIRPQQQVWKPCGLVTDNMGGRAGTMRILPDGSIDFFKHIVDGSGDLVLSASFTTIGEKGFHAFVIEYPVYPE